MPISAIDFGQGWLLSRMRTLYGDQVNARGVCFGVAHMGIQANLVGEHDKFIERMRMIASIPEERFAEEIAGIREDRMKGKPAGATYEEIPALLEGIMLYQSPRLFPEWFTPEEKPLNQQAAILTAPLVSSQLIDDKGGLYAIDLKTGAYDQLDLTLFFERILTVMRADPPIQIPFSFSFGANNHRISFSYNPEKAEWYIDDANQMNRFARPIDANTKISTLAQHFSVETRRAFTDAAQTAKMIMCSTLYSTNDNQASLKLLQERLDNDPKYSRIYNITKFNANPYLPDDELTWLEVCAYERNVAQVSQLLESGAIIRSFKGVPVIVHAAIVERDIEMQACVLSYLKAHPERFTELSVAVVATSQLSDAIKSNSVEMVRLLLAYDGDVNRVSVKLQDKALPRIKELLLAWHSLKALMNDLTTAVDLYQKKKPESRTRFIEDLRDAIQAAKQSLADPNKNIDEITRELIQKAEDISISIKKDHAQNSPMLSRMHFGSMFVGTKSQLARQIDGVLQRVGADEKKLHNYKPR